MSVQNQITRIVNAKAAIKSAIEGKGVTVPSGTKIDGMAEKITAIPTKKSVTWHQCPAAVKNYLANVTYNPSDYTTSRIAEFAPATAVLSNTKPIGKTVDGVTYYNEIPNVATPFSSTSEAGTITPLDRLRWINSQAVNVRDLGGWNCDGGTVKYGKIYRGGRLNSSDRELFVNQLGIIAELDLRGISEAGGASTSVLGEDVLYCLPKETNWYSLQDQSGTTSTWKEVIRFIFDAANKNIPLYFHCSAGADRTGTLACVLEAMLGMSQSDIDKDYELTCFSTGTSTDTQARRRNESEWQGLINAIKAVPLVGGLTDNFRNRAVSFVLSLGFTIDEINAFRSAMISGAPSAINPTMNSYAVTKTLRNASLDNENNAVTQFQPFISNVLPVFGAVIRDVSVKMGGVDITSDVWGGVETFREIGIRNTLTHCTTSNAKETVVEGEGYVADITADNGYTLDGSTILIKMGGVDVSTYYLGGKIAIPEVTGQLEITITAVSSGPAYTNLLPTAKTPGDLSTIFNGVGYMNGKYASSASPYYSDDANFVCTGLIPCEYGDVIYLKGNTIDASASHARFSIADANGAMAGNAVNLAGGYYGTFEEIGSGNNYYKFTRNVNRNPEYPYACFSVQGTGENLIITRNEVIE